MKVWRKKYGSLKKHRQQTEIKEKRIELQGPMVTGKVLTPCQVPGQILGKIHLQ